MDKNRKTAFAVGVLILLAYSLLGTGDPNAKLMGMTLEIVSGISVVAISVLMFPLFLPYNKSLSLWYIALKSIEGGLMIIAGMLFLSHNTLFLEIRDGIYVVHGYIFAIPAMIFYYLMYQSKLIPQWISIWGFIATILLVSVNLLEVAGYSSKFFILLYLPIVLNEVFLAAWLMSKGFTK